MIGVCTGKVRSTPTPKLTLRTVKVSRTPPPCRRITTPWKICTRCRLPSTTRTWTLSVSPARKAGTSLRFESASRSSRVCMSRVLTDIAGRCAFGGSRSVRTRFRARENRGFPSLLCHRIRWLGLTAQVRPALPGPPDRLLPPPPRHRPVVAGQQHRRHRPTGELRRSGVDGRLQQALTRVGERIVGDGLG